MGRDTLALLVLSLLLGCSTTNKDDTQLSGIDSTGNCDTIFSSRIIYEDNTPYIGIVRIEGDSWASNGTTDSNGGFTLCAVMDDDFILSALSPWDNRTYLYYNEPITINKGQ